MSMSLLLKRGAGVPLAAALRSVTGAQSQARVRVPAWREGAAALLCRKLQCNAAVNAHSCTQIAVEDCLKRVLGPSAPSRSEFAVIFYEGHDGAQVQEALELFASRNPDTPPVFGCSLGGNGQLQHGDYFPRPDKSEQSKDSHGHGNRIGWKGANAPHSTIMIGPQSESDSESESDATDAEVDSASGADSDSVVFAVRDDGGEGSDHAFSGDALMELLGNVDDVIDALEEPRGGKKKGRNGRRARRMAKKKQMEQQLQQGKRM